MNMKAISLAICVLSALVVSCGSHMKAVDEQIHENVVVKAAGTEGLTYLKAFDSRFRAALKQKGLPPGDIQCIGCDGLDSAASDASPKELSYFFPGSVSGIGDALLSAWIMDAGRADESRLTFLPPTCSNYPEPPTCYSRPTCSGGATPFCRRSPTKSCATAGSCL